MDMANGHGGARKGAGRPRKSLADKIYEGSTNKHRPKVLDIPSLEDIPMPETPDFLRQLNAVGIGNKVPKMEEIYDKTAAWLKNTGCLHLVNPDLIAEYALMKTRSFESEDIVSRLIMYKEKIKGKGGESDGFVIIPNPMYKMSLDYNKAAGAA